MADDKSIPEILRSAKTIAVVGLSQNPQRPSHGVASYLQSAGYRIIPVNPNYSGVLGETCYPNLLVIPDTIQIDVVNIFRRSDAVMPIVEDALQIGTGAIWMQEGVVNEPAADRARKAGIWVIMDRCILKEHIRYV